MGQTMKYSPFEIDKALQSMRIIADTREQDTAAFRRRFAACGLQVERRKLDFGDYTAVTTIGNDEICLADKVVVERKMGLVELCMCFGKERARFQREFQRAAVSGAKTYLLVENATWENILAGKYRSKLHPNALKAAIWAWTARYNIVPVFCKAEISGSIIADILHYELRAYLEGAE